MRSIQPTIWFSLCVITLLSGCVPSGEQAPTQLKRISEVKISVGTTKTEEPEETPATPSADPPASTPAESAAPVASASTEKMTEKPAAAPVSTETPKPAPQASTGTGPATFSGRVVVKGAKPNLPPLVPKGKELKDAVCSAEEVPDQSVLVSDDGGLANCFVYMKRGPKDGVPAPDDSKPLLDQKGCVFIPHAQIVRTGVTFQLKNSDPVAHNVHSLPFKNKGLNSLIPGNDETGLETTFEYAESLPVRVVCDIHAWMTSYVLPIDHPWATITDENGNFEIKNLPDGEWTFIVWHEKIGNIEAKFEVKASPGQTITQEFSVDASKLTQ